jgi:hypothetical protein
MDFAGDADALMREIDASRSSFDKWAAEQLEVIRSLSQEEQQQRTDFDSAIAALATEQKKIEQRTNQAQHNSRRLTQQGRLQADEHTQLKIAISAIPKQIKYLENLKYIFQVRRNRLLAKGEPTDAPQCANTRELQVFESLYGFAVSCDQKRITFAFKRPEGKVVLQEDENGQFRIVSAPLAVGRIQETAVRELNAKRELLRFIAAVRSCLK